MQNYTQLISWNQNKNFKKIKEKITGITDVLSLVHCTCTRKGGIGLVVL
jgi:hypothetical protein